MFDQYQKLVLATGVVACGMIRYGFHLPDLGMNGCSETWRPALNSIYHFSYVWGSIVFVGLSGRLILSRLDKKYGRIPNRHAV